MIEVLSKDLVNKIAAGEVVERPASVVKELVENALDALATNITVRITGGGLKRITVEDDGDGISQLDAPKLFVKHATSKIHHKDDLSRITTFGFRGEAIASIASISHMKIVTHNKEDASGITLSYEDEKKEIKTAAATKGTIVTVDGLFFNIPARRKFMKSEKTENAYCIKIVKEIAILHPEVSFSLYCDDKMILHLEKQLEDERIHAIVKEELLPMHVLYAGEDISVRAALCPPGSLSHSSEQYIFVNARPIVAPLIQKAIKEAYKSYLTSDRKPSYIISLFCAPEFVDVNVHPRKTEVRFVDQNQIYNVVYSGVTTYFATLSKPTRSMQETMVVAAERNSQPNMYQKQSHLFGISTARETMIAFESEIPVTHSDQYHDTQFLQIDKKLIVFEKNESLVIVDQHAASERIRYEKLFSEFRQQKISFISALFPLHLDVSVDDYVFLADHLNEFHMYGIDVELLGNSIVSIEKLSTHIPAFAQERIFYEVLGYIKEGSVSKQKTSLDEKIIASIACRGAIMFGQELSRFEMEQLMRELDACDTPFTCAHGRPIQYVIPLGEIMKKLARC